MRCARPQISGTTSHFQPHLSATILRLHFFHYLRHKGNVIMAPRPPKSNPTDAQSTDTQRLNAKVLKSSRHRPLSRISNYFSRQSPKGRAQDDVGSIHWRVDDQSVSDEITIQENSSSTGQHIQEVYKWAIVYENQRGSVQTLSA